MNTYKIIKTIKNYLYLVMLTLFSFNINAQEPHGFNYQATVRNANGDLTLNANVYFKFNIMQGSQTSEPVYIETHYVSTDDLGQVTLAIGQGTPITGVFSEIDWSLGSYFLGVELNTTGQSYVAMGTSKLLSVPYALYAANSGNTTSSLTLESVLSTNNSAGQQQIKNLLDPTDPTDAVTKSYADALSMSSELMNFNKLDNQVWNDNTTVQLESNSFFYVNANHTTLVFPEATNNCCIGDVIYIYVMQANDIPQNFVLQPSGSNVAINTGGSTLISTATEQIQGVFETGGLQTIVNIGNYWMVGNFAGILGSSEDDHNHENEVITTVNYTLTNGSDEVTLTFIDLDGEGGNEGTYDISGSLIANTTYTGTIELLNETEDPAKDISEEIREEKDRNEFFYTSTVAGVVITKTDDDGNGNSLGIDTSVTTGAAGSGSITIVLKHEPTKPNDGTSEDAGGSTDIQVTFDVTVQ